MLLMVGSGRLKAEDGQPRIYIPSVEFSDNGKFGFSAITPKNPYFTLYVWYKNTDHNHAYWMENPKLIVDGHETTLYGIANESGSGQSTTCRDKDNNVLYWVHFRESFKVRDKDFTMSFPLKQLGGNPDEDHYAVYEIMFPTNTGGEQHSVSVKGKAHLDKHSDGVYNALGLDGDEVITNSKTEDPFALVANANTTLTWTDPGKLTFKSQAFNKIHKWGFYMVNLDGQDSEERKNEGPVSVTKDCGAGADYQDETELPVTYTYADAFDWGDPEQTKENPCSFSMEFNYSNPDYVSLSDFNNHGFNNYASCYRPNSSLGFLTPTNLDLDIDNIHWNKDSYYRDVYAYNEATFTFKSCDTKYFKQVTFHGTINSEPKSYTWSGYSKSGQITLPQGLYFESIDFVFDRPAYGNNLEFTKSSSKAPVTLPYPDNLSADCNPWARAINLRWDFENVNTSNYQGTFRVLRDGTEIKSINTTSGISYSYTDATADYDKDYTYTVTFTPTGWKDQGSANRPQFSATFNLQHTVSLSELEATALTDGYQLNWALNTPLNNADNYVFNIYRIVAPPDSTEGGDGGGANPSADKFGAGDLLATVRVTDPTQQQYQYIDKAVNSESTYAYMVTIYAQQKTFICGPTIPDGHPDGSKVKTITATRGTYSDKVRVHWETVVMGDDVMKYELYRHQINEGENMVNTLDEALQLDWVLLTTEESSATSFTYDDESAVCGRYYVYALVVRSTTTGQVKMRRAVDGFARSTGKVYGAVTYQNSRFAVEGATVTLQAGDKAGRSQFNSLALNGSGRVNWKVSSPQMNTYFRDRAFSVQLYVNPDTVQQGKCLLDMDGTLQLSLGNYDPAKGYAVTAQAAGRTFTSSLGIKPGVFTSLTLTYDGQGDGWLYLVSPDSLGRLQQEQLLRDAPLTWQRDSDATVSLGARVDRSQGMKGYVDEVRFFKRQLTQADVLQNYNHFMGGTEEGLVAYWSFDEGISTLRHAYDYTMTQNNSANDNTANIEGCVRSHTLPEENQLSLFAVTDTLGQYTVQGIPFTGEGTTYIVKPGKGEHHFNPETRTIYVSPTTLSFDPQNFDDVSSFNVKGFVYYENTTYPVAGCRFRVDDTVVKDEWGHEITSNENGEFVIPVSIGQHAIYIEKEGHTFLNGGRYPAEGLLNVNDSINDLTFTDQTKVVVAGRVVGGLQEKSKPLGLGLSTANVGVATLTLITSADITNARRMNVLFDKEEGIFYDNPDTLKYEAANPQYVHSRAYTLGSSGQDAVKKLIIHTDSLTGEFAVLLPPVPYYVSTNVNNNEEATVGLDKNVMFDASNVLRTDSVEADGVKFFYNTAIYQTYIATPTISVRQTDNEWGAFGEPQVTTKAANDSTVVVDVYTVSGGTPTYHFGYPIFEYGGDYTLEVSSFERYVNYDGPQPVEYRQPTQGNVNFSNMISGQDNDSTAVVPLDSAGVCQYTFQALNPNIADDYTRSLSILVRIGDNGYPWYWETNDEGEWPLTGFVFGSVLTGKNFVTSAPDVLVNILRDPFGSNSKLSWKSGSTKSVTHKVNANFNLSFDSTSQVTGGEQISAGSGIPGNVVLEGMSAKTGYSHSFNIDFNGGRNGLQNWKFTTTNTYSTSGAAGYDGPQGDVFIGCSTSLTYGDGKQVKLISDQQNGWQVGIDDAIVVSEGVESDFAYSQYYIENELLPGYLKLRNDLLRPVTESELQGYLNSYVNDSGKPVYMTTRRPTDANFGASNDTIYAWPNAYCLYGNSYTVFWPKNDMLQPDTTQQSLPEDEVNNYNEQIRLWKEYLADNEEAKVKAINSGRPEHNWSYETGSPYTYTDDDTFNFSEGVSLQVASKGYRKITFDAKVSGTKFAEQAASFTFTIAHTRQPSLQYDQTESDTYTIELADNVADNSHNIDVYQASDDYSRIFVQRGGQTSRMYEGEQRTKYFEPGQHVISSATVQIETPHISCEKTIVSGVPQGKSANFDLVLSNPTSAQVVKPIDFELFVDNDKWSKMAKVSVNGNPLTGATYPILLTPGQSATVTLNVEPASPEYIHIDSLHVSFYSVGQKTISDDIILAAHFLPQTEPVQLAASPGELVYTGTDSTVVLTATGYDLNSTILNAVRLQQRVDGASEWTTIRSYVKSNPMGSGESLLKAEGVDTLVDMHSSIFYPDCTYQFRAVTDCTVGQENALGESNIITIVKDVTRPQPISLPEPADGVLGTGDEISVSFNEDIVGQALNKADNFIVQSVLNTDSVAHETALRLDGSATPAASTETGLTLGNTSFTLCTWVKHVGTPGTLLRHGEGENAFRLNIDADGYLSVCITDSAGLAQPYRSSQAIPVDVWSYVALVYDVNKGRLSAYCANGDNERVLMTDVEVGRDATSQGNIYLGEGLTGAMHELTLFSTALTWSTIKTQMYLGKSHSTPTLIGYWRLDEGNGMESEDRARSRTMRLASANGWYLENENLSLALDGTNAVAIPMGMLSVTEGISYLVEMWALADENQADGAQLLSLDNGQKLDLNIVDGQLQLVADSIAYNPQPSTLNFTDHQWHHVALNVLKGIDKQTTLLVDGTAVLTLESDKVPALAGARLWLGRNMKGMLDEVRLWHGTNTQETISERMYHRLDGKEESGLKGYYPMEDSYFDEYHQRVFTFSLDNQGYEATASTTLVSEHEDVTPVAGDNAPGLKTAPHKSNLSFSFVADERKVKITLDHSAAALEDCTVSTTLRNYSDMHLNTGNPVTWTFKVKQNSLSWNTGEVSTRAKAGEEATFTATLKNNGKDDQQWLLTKLPTWLEASPSEGSIAPYNQQEVTFTVKPGNPIGKYFATVSVQGYKDIETPLDVSLTVEGNKPDWEDHVSRYGESMTVVAQVRINGILSTDPDDIVGAFILTGDEPLGECVGVGHPVYNKSRDAYYASMLVFGTNDMKEQKVYFRLYDASTGHIYPLTNATPEVTFFPDSYIGSITDPVILENQDKLLQLLELKETTKQTGSQWISFYLEPQQPNINIFTPVMGKMDELALSTDTVLSSSNGFASDRLHTIHAGKMMKVTMNADATLPVVGSGVNPADYPFTIHQGVNWVGVPTSSYMTVEKAFAGLSPEEGDQVKSMTQVSIYQSGEWMGTLEQIEPGQGYIYTSMAGSDKVFTFPDIASDVPQYHAPNLGSTHRSLKGDNMVVICTIHDEDGNTMQAKSVEAYDALGELRGQATRCFKDSLYILLIHGDREDEPIIIKPDLIGHYDDMFGIVLRFSTDAIHGSLRQPLVIQAVTTNGIHGELWIADGGLNGSNAGSLLTIYSTSGQLVYRGRADEFDRRKLPAGRVYIVSELTPDGLTFCRKMEINK